MSVIPWYKYKGETPKQAIDRLRQAYPCYAQHVITYAGRLDPLAHGVLLLLSNEDRLKKESYQKFTKAYQVSFVLGISTDTHDLLGVIQNVAFKRPTFSYNEIKDTLEDFIGEHQQKFPGFSAKRVHGKPLFQHAKDGTLDAFERPTQSVEITRLSLDNIDTKTTENIAGQATEAVQLVTGDFRQKEIITKWRDVFSTYGNHQFQSVSCSVYCSSGTYIRQLIRDVGGQLGIGAVITDLYRYQVGEWKLDQ